MSAGRALFANRLAPDGSLVAQNFDRWFGDSKARGADGLPLRLFHGTFSEFDSFLIENCAAEGAAFFTEDPAIASAFADAEAFGHDLDDEEICIEPNVIPVYLSIWQPLTLHAHEVMIDCGPAAQVRWAHSQDKMRAAVRRARREGHDGLLLLQAPDGGGVSDQWAVFHPWQVKSAIGNSGLFDVHSDSLTDARAERTLEQAHRSRERMGA